MQHTLAQHTLAQQALTQKRMFTIDLHLQYKPPPGAHNMMRYIYIAFLHHCILRQTSLCHHDPLQLLTPGCPS
jgi:hypothetical protein